MTCSRCGSSMLQEPFQDLGGAGHVRFCLACGHRVETYTSRPPGWESVDEQRRLFDSGKRRMSGRPRIYRHEE